LVFPASGHPPGRDSQCEPFRETIGKKLDQGLSAQRIWQDLVGESGFTGSYSSVKRFVRRFGAHTPFPFRRMECEPGQEGQVDWSPYTVELGDEQRIVHGFSLVLPWSRYMVLRFALDEQRHGDDLQVQVLRHPLGHVLQRLAQIDAELLLLEAAAELDSHRGLHLLGDQLEAVGDPVAGSQRANQTG
jgi:hypothetical protein